MWHGPILQPLLATLVFSIFFGRLAQMPSDGVPYPVFALRGLVPWQYLRQRIDRVVQQPGGEPEPDHEGLFPAPDHSRWASVIAGLVDFCLRLHHPDRDDVLLRDTAEQRRSFLFPVFLCWR